MDYIDDLKDKQQIRDQLGRDDNTYQVFDLFSDTIVIEELTTVIKSNVIGTSFILGHPVNGIIGTGGYGLGEDPIRLVKTIRSVTNYNNIFKDYLRGTTFIGTATTATVDVNAFTITF